MRGDLGVLRRCSAAARGGHDLDVEIGSGGETLRRLAHQKLAYNRELLSLWSTPSNHQVSRACARRAPKCEYRRCGA